MLFPARSRDRRDDRAAAAIGACIVASAAASVAVRWVGASEAIAGAALAIAIAAILAGFVIRRLLTAGVRKWRAAGWAVALLCASAGPPLLSVFPGRLAADATVRSPGDTVPLPTGAHGRVRVLVSAALPEKTFVGFTLRGRGSTLDGTLGRGTRWIGSGEEKRHYHEERSSVLVDGALSGGASPLVLDHIGGGPIALRVRVFVPIVPGWLAPLMSTLVMAAFGLLHAEVRRHRATIVAGCAAGCSGIFAGLIATPEAAVGSVLAGTVLGALTGTPLAIALQALGRTLSRWVRARAQALVSVRAAEFDRRDHTSLLGSPRPRGSRSPGRS